MAIRGVGPGTAFTSKEGPCWHRPSLYVTQAMVRSAWFVFTLSGFKRSTFSYEPTFKLCSAQSHTDQSQTHKEKMTKSTFHRFYYHHV